MRLEYADAEGAARAWVRALPDFVAGRCFFGVPDRAVYPLVVVQRVGRGPSAGDVPIGRALIQFDLIGEDHRSKAQVGALAVRLESEAESLIAGTPMGTAIGLSAEVTRGPDWRPVPGSLQARYLLDVMFQLRAV